MSMSLQDVEGPDAIPDLTSQYLDSLRGPQEAWLQEQLSRHSVRTMLILSGGERAGYACVDAAKGLLLQFFLRPSYLRVDGEAFEMVLERLRVRRAFATTRDAVALSLCLTYSKKVALEAYLFECGGGPVDIPPLFDRSDLRAATGADVPAIRELAGDFFENPERQVAEGCLHLLESDRELIGVGYASDRFCTPGTANLGLIVGPDRRREGVGTSLLIKLAGWCRARNWAPIAACYHENLASRKALEKSGFVARDRTFLADFPLSPPTPAPPRSGPSGSSTPPGRPPPP